MTEPVLTTPPAAALSDHAPLHIAIVLHVQGDPKLESEAIGWAEACRLQMLDLARAWPTKGPPPSVFYYGTAEGIPPEHNAVVGIFRDAGDAGAEGYHLALGSRVIGAVDLSRSDKPSVVLSHEVCEIFGNCYLDAWVPSPVAGRDYALELCDPVQSASYEMTINLFGEQRQVEVADFILPAWFDFHATGPRDACKLVSRPFEVLSGGYQIAREGDNTLYLPAPGEAISRALIDRPLSRTHQITNRITVARPGQAERSKP